MARSIRDLKKTAQETPQVPETPRFTGPESDRDISSGIRAAAEKYSGKSEDELMAELLRVTAEQKREGSFDADAMRQTAGSILPYLDARQAEKLRRIIDMIG